MKHLGDGDFVLDKATELMDENYRQNALNDSQEFTVQLTLRAVSQFESDIWTSYDAEVVCGMELAFPFYLASNLPFT